MSEENGYLCKALKDIQKRALETYWSNVGLTPEVAKENNYFPFNLYMKRLERIKEDFKEKKELNINNYTMVFQANNADKRDIEANNYKIQMVLRKWVGPGMERKIGENTFFDTDYVIKLDDGEPIAACGFEPNFKNHSLEIKQLQGVKGKQKHLKPIKWERMLVQIVSDYAKVHNFDEIRIQTAEENKWIGEFPLKEKFERFHLRYDVTAKRMGFERDSKYWYKKLDDIIFKSNREK